jgi:hypothetical protein
MIQPESRKGVHYTLLTRAFWMQKNMGNIGRSIILSAMLFACTFVQAAYASAQDEILSAPSQTENGKKQGNDKSNCDKRSPISTYKINYFALNNLPNNDNAQVKFQLSVKYKFFDRIFRGDVPSPCISPIPRYRSGTLARAQSRLKKATIILKPFLITEQTSHGDLLHFGTSS